MQRTARRLLLAMGLEGPGRAACCWGRGAPLLLFSDGDHSLYILRFNEDDDELRRFR
jgi:hypothetical protein